MSSPAVAARAPIPVDVDAGESGKVWFCACKATGKAPLCDGSHKKLP